MTNQQQPECQEDRIILCPRCNGDGCFRCGDSGIANEADDYRARLEEAEARVKELESVCDAHVRLLGDAQQTKDSQEAKLARVKALLDGVGPVLESAKKANESGVLTNAGFYVPNEYAADLSQIEADLPALLSAISEVREVLKGE